MKVTVNISGGFGAESIKNETLELNLEEGATVKDLLKSVNSTYNTSVFSKGNMKSRLFVVMVNGTSIPPKNLKKTELASDDVISILQPIPGG